MQVKDIPTTAILQHLAHYSAPHTACGQWDSSQCGQGHWCLWISDNPSNMACPFPINTPFNLMLAKMRNLIKHGLAAGCDCGCRGDFEITEKGKQFLVTESNKNLL